MLIPPTRAEAAANELRRRILQGIYPGGMPLRQVQLAEELGISRIPFREALVQLEAEGLVTTVPHKGSWVAEVSADDVAEQFAFRALLEPDLLRLSAPRLTEGDFDALHAILARYSSGLQAQDISHWGEMNTELHGLLLSRAGRPRMLAVAMQLLRSTDRFTRLQIFLTDGRRRAEAEHADLVRLSQAGQVEAAADLLRSHILAAGTALADVLRARRTVTPEPA